ncbi:MAG: polysaccharide biosynthesis protein [Clostridia bacterium]|nr:polysaccharide biosynthesis protein [Clostridia bacterium]
MHSRTKRVLGLLAILLWDIISTVASALISFRICYSGHFHEANASNLNPLSWVPVDMQYGTLVLFLLIAACAIVFLNLIFGNYDNVMRHFGIGEMVRVLLAWGTFTVAFYVICKVNEMFSANFNYVVILSFLILICQMAGRSIGRLMRELSAKINSVSRSRNPESVRTLIFGAGEAGAYLVKKVKIDKTSNVLPVVMIDDDKSLIGSKIHGVLVYGGSEKLGEAIRKYKIDEVVVAIPTATKQLLKFAIDVCSENKCRIRRFGSVSDIELDNVKVTHIDIEELLRRDSVSLNMNIVREFVENKTVMVTGGAGSIGSEICRQVLSFGCKHLVVFDIHENGLYDIENELNKKYRGKFSLRLGSIRDKKRINEVFEEFSPQVVFHAAAHKHVPMMEYSPKEAIKNNVRGTINVAMSAILHKVDKFILISTDKAVNPTNIMGASKRIAEMAIQLLNTFSDTDLSAVRFGNVLGSNGSVVPLFRKQIEEGGPVCVTHPDIKRYFMTIPEAVQLVLEAGAMADGGEIFVLNMGEPVKIYDLACDLIRLSGYEPNVDIKIEFTGLRPGEKLFEELSLEDEDFIKTQNDKIMIMKPMEFDATELSTKLKELETLAENEDTSTMFDKVRELVPTFNHE